MKTAFVSSGQGSQYVGMIKDLAEKYPAAASLCAKADDVLGYSISQICFEGPLETLKETRYTQPALFLHSAIAYELIKNKIKPDCSAGHSVGEFAALYVAGVLDFESALKLVSLRGNLMFSAGLDKPGTMFAVVGMDDDKVREVCASLAGNNGNVCVPANFNSPGQVVISGSRDFLRENATKFKEAGAKLVKELVVSGAFHSPLMEPAREELAKQIDATDFKTPGIPVYTNVYAVAETNPANLKESLKAQLTSPVLWTQTVVNMKADGISDFVEIGAGNVLQGLVKRIVSDVNILGADTAADIEKIQSL